MKIAGNLYTGCKINFTTLFSTLLETSGDEPLTVNAMEGNFMVWTCMLLFTHRSWTIECINQINFFPVDEIETSCYILPSPTKRLFPTPNALSPLL